MKHLNLIICLFSIITIAGCQKSNNTPATPPPAATPITTTPASKLLGTRTFHGLQMTDIKFFDSINNVMTDTIKTETVFATIIFTSSAYSPLILTFSQSNSTFANTSTGFIYASTDSASQTVLYYNKYGGDHLIYYYAADSVDLKFYSSASANYFYYP